MSNIKITLIVAATENNAIGRNNKMLWHLPDDFKYFKRNTIGHSVVMGRKTFDSIGKPLPERRNIVLTHNINWMAEGVDVANSMEEIMLYCRDEREVYIIGGANLYKQALSMAHKVLITRVHTTMEGDAYFPELSPMEWILKQQEYHSKDEKHAYDFTFEVWERK